MAYVKIRPRRGTPSQWEYANPILAEGEMAFEVPESGVGTGAINIKQGDGQTSWVNLPYAFNAANLNTKVDELINTVATYDATIANLSNSVAQMEEEVQNVRKIDIQGTEPDTNLILGEIWINTDMVTGAISVSPNTVTLEVGSSTRLTLANTLSAWDAITWASSDPLLVSISNDGPTGATITAKLEAENVRITASAKLNGATIYTAACTVKVTVSGGLIIQPEEMRLVIGKIGRCTLTNSLAQYDDIVWTSSAPYYASVGTYSDTYADIEAILSGSATIYARAQLNGSFIATDSMICTIVGMTLNKTSASIGIGETVQLALANTMTYGLDYDYIGWASTGENVATIAASSATGASIVGVAAGTCTIIATATLEGNFVQKVQATISVQGSISIEPSSKSMQVGETSSLALRNTLEAGSYDLITWTVNEEAVVRITSVSPSKDTAFIEARAAGNAVVTVTAYLNNQYVASGSCVIVSTGRIDIDQNSPTVSRGSSTTLTCTNTLSRSQWNQIRWTTSASDIVSIVSQSENNCTIEGMSAGSAVITVRAVDINGATVSEDFTTVTVTA